MAQTSKGAISSPLATSATTLNPLTISLDLSSLEYSTDSSNSTTCDIFDQLDAARNIDVAPRHPPKPTAAEDSSNELHTVTPLVDSTALLFPSTAEYASTADQQQPSWIHNTSERVTALVATRLPSAIPARAEMAGNVEQNGGRTTHQKGQTRLLVAAATQSGSLWFFSPPTPPPSAPVAAPTPTPPPFNHSSRRTSSSSLARSVRSPPPASSSSSRPNSPPPGLSLSTTSPPISPSQRHAFPSSSNAPTSRKRHASVTPSSSSPSHPSRPAGLAHRNSSASLATRRSISHAGGSETPQGQPSRLRKASATVSISPSSFPDFSSSSATAASAPMSPSLSSTSRASYSRDWDATSIKSPTMQAPSVVLSSPSPTRSHTRAKASITTGIGLWESESVGAQSLEDLVTPSLEGDETEEQEEESEPELNSLLPRMRVRPEGAGAVGKMEVVQGVRLGREEEEGGVLVALRSDGTLSIHSLVDGRALGSCHAESGRRKGKEKESPAASASISAGTKAQNDWEGFKILHLAEATVALLHAPSRLAIIDLDTMQAQECVNVAVGSAVSVVKREGIHFLVYSSPSPSTNPPSETEVGDSSATISLRPLFLVAPPAPASTPSASLTTTSTGSTHSHSVPSAVQVRIDHSHSAGTLPLHRPLLGLCELEAGEEGGKLLAWNDEGVVMFELREQTVLLRARMALKGVRGMEVQQGKVLMRTEKELRVYELRRGDAETEEAFAFELLSTHPLSGTESAVAIPTSSPDIASRHVDFLVARSQLAPKSSSSTADDTDEYEGSPVAQPTVSVRSLELLQLLDEGSSLAEQSTPRVLYEARHPSSADTIRPRVTASVRLDRERVIVGCSLGSIRELHFSELNSPLVQDGDRTAQLGGAITVLQLLEVQGRQVLVAGAVNGAAGAWDPSDWSLLGRWNLFASPVSHLACLWDVETASTESDDPSARSPISHTLAFISANSPVALISLSLSSSTSSITTSLSFVLPGTASPVESLSTSESSAVDGSGEILVIYQQGLARVCHLETRELRRSMDRKTAKGVLKEEGKGWRTWFEIGDEGEAISNLVDPILTLDLRSDLDEALRCLPWAGESKRPSRKAATFPSITSNGVDTPLENGNGTPTSGSTKESLALRRMLLGNLATFGLDKDTDDLLSNHLGVTKPQRQLGSAVVSSRSLSFPLDDSPSSLWTISPVATAQRLLQIVCLLRVFLNFPETERYASQAIVFYASFLQDAVGGSFAFPSLDVLADYWLDKSTEVQQAARSLFGTYLGASSNVRVFALVERWQDLLPARQVEGSPLFGSADQALLVAGLIATERYKLLSAAVLKDIALSISLYLDDERHPYHQSIATELCSRGFNIWQHYLDAMSLVRQLFGLATGRNPSTPNELRGLARMATLHVAGVNTPLFITTLLHDILDAPSATHRNATLKLLGFMIRKKPLVLYTSLPRIAEAVVKSLDPTVTDLRETVHQAATVILNELVRTYPSIDFHHKSQRLAVGTHEGSTIIYDLKTATRLYVLEGHKRPVTALSWSPDGHRLVSVSLEESKAVVWKVGLGILSMFMPGAPPRQGSGAATQPFKTFEFHVGAEAHMTNAATLEWVVFDWPADRTARLRIRETALNFGT